MTRNRDTKELEREIERLEDILLKNKWDIDKYTSSIRTSVSIIENLKSDLADETNIIEETHLELNVLKTSDIEDKERLDELRKTLDVMKNGLPDTGKAFTNPRHKSEKTISHFRGVI